MMRILVGTFWSVLFAFGGLAAGVTLDRFSVLGASRAGHVGPIFAGLVLGLAAFSALREPGWLPGLANQQALALAGAPARPGGGWMAVFAGLFWALALGLAGAAVGHGLERHVFAAASAGPRRGLLAAGGMVAGLLLLIPLYRLGWLAGLGRARGRWETAQAIFLLVGFIGAQALAQGVLVLVVMAVRRAGQATGHVMVLNSDRLLIGGIAAGYLTAALWSLWYIGRLGPARLTEGGPHGIGWRAAPKRAYLVAIGGLLVVSALEAAVQHVWPPTGNDAQTNLYAHIFGGSRYGVAMLFLLAAILAPPVEELVFRGGVLSALSARCATWLAALLTTLMFTAAHFLEFQHYWPGMLVIFFVAVVLMWLRLTYRSLRPGILLHALFNGMSVLALAFGR